MSQVNQGFTLLEMLVAIAVFALLSLMGQQVVDNVMRADASSEQHQEMLQTVLSSMQMLNHDVSQMVPRSIRGSRGVSEPTLLAGHGMLDSDSEGVRFIRGGLVNPQMQLPRSHLVKVGYRIHQEHLERLVWPVVDSPDNVKPTVQRLMPAKQLTLQFYDGQRWVTRWDSAQALPQALRMTFDSPLLGNIDRIWLLRGPRLVFGEQQ
ncbi:MAG: type II secretion system minor pseudopilin GspJ [Plesiomonas shigelloides]